MRFCPYSSFKIYFSLPSFIKFTIIDTGIGIEPEKLSVIFDNFEQGKRSRSQVYGGTGLGLSISKRLVEIQKGKIWVDSELDKGSTFTFELPKIEVTTQKEHIDTNQNENIEALANGLEGLKILLVDDDEFNLMVVQDDLNYYLKNTTIYIAENGIEAIEAFKKNELDIILMDMHMPKMDGCEATKNIRIIEQQNNTRIPIIAMTANIIKSEIDKCISSGMDDYIPKPYKVDILITKIHKWIKQ